MQCSPCGISIKVTTRIRNSGLPYAVQSLWNIQQSFSLYHETRRFITVFTTACRTERPFLMRDTANTNPGSGTQYPEWRNVSSFGKRHCRVSGSRRFEGLYRLHLQGSAVQLILPWLLDTKWGKTILRNAMKHSPNYTASLPTTTASLWNVRPSNLIYEILQPVQKRLDSKNYRTQLTDTQNTINWHTEHN